MMICTNCFKPVEKMGDTFQCDCKTVAEDKNYPGSHALSVEPPEWLPIGEVIKAAKESSDLLAFIANSIYMLEAVKQNELPVRWLCMAEEYQNEYLKKARIAAAAWITEEKENRRIIDERIKKLHPPK